ncbi:hypothetical protein BV20DRAFT_486976 [Pilatotrama ljubarskyi]|nr:hypothetical protein BV20DRAFT_486976 [Pilatotrama ljubarskyi]
MIRCLLRVMDCLYCTLSSSRPPLRASSAGGRVKVGAMAGESERAGRGRRGYLEEKGCASSFDSSVGMCCGWVFFGTRLKGVDVKDQASLLASRLTHVVAPRTRVSRAGSRRADVSPHEMPSERPTSLATSDVWIANACTLELDSLSWRPPASYTWGRYWPFATTSTQ